MPSKAELEAENQKLKLEIMRLNSVVSARDQIIAVLNEAQAAYTKAFSALLGPVD